MNTPNPFVPQGSLLEQQSRRRFRLKVGVSCVLAVCVTGLVAMLIQGCERKKPDEPNQPPPELTNNNNLPDFNNGPAVPAFTNPPTLPPPPVVETNPPTPPQPPQPPVVNPPQPEGTVYTIVSGDTLGKIAKRNNISLKALQAANPGVDSTRLRVGQKINIPAGGTPAANATPTANGTTASSGGGDAGATYVVKSGDTLTRIAKNHGTTVKALQAANNLATTRIHVGQRLKIPAKAAAAATAPAAPAVQAVPEIPKTPAAQDWSAPAAPVPPATPAPGRL